MAVSGLEESQEQLAQGTKQRKEERNRKALYAYEAVLVWPSLPFLMYSVPKYPVAQ